MKTVLLVGMAFIFIAIMFFLPIFIIYDEFFFKQFVKVVDSIVDVTEFYKGLGIGGISMLLFMVIVGAARNWK